ncbi:MULTISPECIES: ABC transporter ATP-binding protein [Frankia]|uniref:Sugar transport ATP-hydrolyzing subunit (Partial match) n=2 Tax=Frankia TaxID=1854 RepID=Q0RS38_FRAAA|nr:putative sugar transport ATP-hydrolyzing subunit (partial match) [Frankia alni ACN14a]
MSAPAPARPDLPLGMVTGVPIEFDRIGRSFGSVHALHEVSLTVAAGEIVALLGPSGSGKSTLLRICAGLDEPTTGDVRFDGTSQLGLPPHRRDVSMVFQHFALYPHKSALDNLTLALRHGRGLPKAAAVARARETLAMLGIAELAGRRPPQMSGGQRQRVAIGRALATRARVILLDEPMSGLDAQLRVELRVEIVGLLRSLGTTALFVTHDQAEAMAVGDRVAVLGEGRLQQIGTPDEIYDRPATRFVAAFVGSPPMNVWDGHWHDGRLRADGFDVPAPAGAAAFGVRPEHLTLDLGALDVDSPGAGTPGVGTPGVGTPGVGTPGVGTPGVGGLDGGSLDVGVPEQPGSLRGVGGSEQLRLSGEVVVSERLGAERTVHVRTRAGVLAVRVNAALALTPGAFVVLRAPTSALTYFAPDGDRLDHP